jgi:hypothetical protein
VYTKHGDGTDLARGRHGEVRIRNYELGIKELRN